MCFGWKRSQRPLIGCAWWQEPLQRATEKWRAAFPEKAVRAFRHESFCSGSMGETIRLKALGVDFVTTSASDLKTSSRAFLKIATGAEHVFVNMGCQWELGGLCTKHLAHCVVEPIRPDIAVGGLPCQPFSRMHHRSGLGPRGSEPEEHPGYQTVMEIFFVYLENRRPLSFAIEEAFSFLEASASGERYLDMFVERCIQQGYATRVLVLDHADWSEMPRKRRCCSISFELRSISP